MPRVTRRAFLRDSAAVTAAVNAATGACSVRPADPADEGERTSFASFASAWNGCHDRVWLGPDYWANPLQDWRVAAGRIECVNPAPNRNVHLLTRQLRADPGELRMSVRVGRIGGKLGDGKGSVGFRIGIRGPLDDYRNALIFGTGLDAGLTADGGLFLGELRAAEAGKVPVDVEQLELRLTILRGGQTVSIEAHDVRTNRNLWTVSRNDVPGARLVGGLALVANFGSAAPRRGGREQAAGGPGAGAFWFADWRLEGDKLEAHDERTFGPILFSQYTLSDGVLTLTAQMPPLGEMDRDLVHLQTGGDSRRPETLTEARIDPHARTATFRLTDWDASRDVPYRLTYQESAPDGREAVHEWTGTIRRDPVDQVVLTVADICCNTHAAFPNHEYVARMAQLAPDLLAFTGDQFYESTGGYGVVRAPLPTAILDYLRKWYLHGWTWRELMRDRPSISLPDDHDVYQGNIWGEAGAGQQQTQEMGGYNMPPEWVNVVHRTQTAHHPPPHDPEPARRGISVYHGPLTYGRVSFAILADRMFKTGPQGVVPPTGGRGDHVVDPNFDPQTADVPGAELLGERQMAFLRQWAEDWRGADMKAVISQTIFTAMATTHGAERQRLRADYDTNGWPQTARNEALRLIRKAFAVHIAGDQHLPAVVHYGIDEHRDAGVAFAGPAVNVGYPRWWEPAEPGRNRADDAPETTGDFTDHFGHPLTVLAVRNGAVQPRRGVIESLTDRASGLAVVRFDKAARTITFECWPFDADPMTDPQFEGWPVTVAMLDNDGRKPAAHLPTLEIDGDADPVVQVVDEADGETLYTLRIAGRRFQPHVFAPGKYTVRVRRPESGRMEELKGLEALAENRAVVRVGV